MRFVGKTGMKVRKGCFVALAALLAWAPRVAEACPVCMAATEEDTRLAFILTTAFLSVLPLLFVGGVVWWLRRRVREIELAARGGVPSPEASVGRGFS